MGQITHPTLAEKDSHVHTLLFNTHYFLKKLLRILSLSDLILLQRAHLFQSLLLHTPLIVRLQESRSLVLGPT